MPDLRRSAEVFYISADELLAQVMTLEDDKAEDPQPNTAVHLWLLWKGQKQTTSDTIALIFSDYKVFF